MAFQGFLKTYTFLSSSRFLLNNRLPQLNQISGIKSKAVDSLKELKIPEKPKRPLTPYFRFLQDHRNTITKKYPDWKVTQVSVQCASDWKSLDQTIKEKYENAYREEMEQYAKKYSKYQNSLTEEHKQALEDYKKEIKESKLRREKRKKLKDNEKPKRPISAYMLYVQEESKNSNKSYFQLLSDLKPKWAELPAGEKARFIQAATKAKEQYDKDLQNWEFKMIEAGNSDLVRQTTLIGKSKK